MSIETYSITTDFGGVRPGHQLQQEIIDDGGIVPNCTSVDTKGDDVNIYFDAALSVGEQTTLDGIVAAHSKDLNVEDDIIYRTITDLDSPYNAKKDSLLCDTTNGNITVNLPKAVRSNKGCFVFKKIAAANTVTVDAFSTELIDGQATQTLTTLNEKIVIQSDGTTWNVLTGDDNVDLAENRIYLPRSFMKGDILIDDGNEPRPLSIGTNNYVLMADSTQTLGIKYGDITEIFGSLDHGTLAGLLDDDHTQYPLLVGRSGGQTIKGGTDANNNLTLESTSHATKGDIIASDPIVAVKITIDNLLFDANTISSTDTNGNINLTPNGTGEVILKANPVNSFGAATKQYVDSLASGFTFIDSVRARTITSLPAYTQAGTGVGATLTADANGALPNIDGITMIANDRILVDTPGSTSDVHNGIYTVTQIGDAGNPWILTRATDADQDAEIVSGLFVVVDEGSCAYCSYIITTPNPIVVDTTAIVFTHLNVGGVSDHGELVGLADDDHLQYTNKNGRSGGQTIKGGISASENLTFESTSNASKGSVIALDPFKSYDIDTNTAVTLSIGKTTTTQIDIGKTGINTDIKSNLNILGTLALYDTSDDHKYIFGVSELTADRTITLPLLTGNDTPVFEAHTQTLTGKTLDSTTNTISADKLHSATTTIDVSSATAPVSGQVLTATSGTTATWQTPDSVTTYSEITSVTTTSTTSATYVVINGMTVTPVAGTYYVTFSASAEKTVMSSTTTYAIHGGGTIIDHSERKFGWDGGGQTNDIAISMHTQAVVTVNGAENIDVKYLDGGQGTTTVHKRSMFLWKIA